MLKPILIQIGPIVIRWYGLLLGAGAIAGFFYAQWIEKRLGAKKIVKDLFFPLAAWGFIGARAYHVVNELPFYIEHPAMIPAVWHGGLAIHGGIIAGAIYLWYAARARRISFLQYADILFPSLLLGQAIGRWGNFFNQELFGAPTSLPWGISIAPENRPEQFASLARFHPAFLYESLWSILVVGIMTLWIKKRAPKKRGIVFAFALTASGLGRAFVEFLRIDAVPIFAGVRLPFLSSVFIAVFGILLFVMLKRKY